MTPEALEALLATPDLAPHAAALAELARPCVRLTPSAPGRGGATAGASRLGGRPDVPKGIRWPEVDGQPMAFVAQLRLDAIAPLAPDLGLPGDGLLLFFYDAAEMPDGLDPDVPAGHVCHVPFGADSKPARFPADLPEEHRFPVLALAPMPALSMPHPHEAVLEPLGLPESYWDLRYDHESEIHGVQVGGWPQPLQDPMREDLAQQGGQAPEDWQLLLMVGEPEGFETPWHEVGHLYVWQPGPGAWEQARVLFQAT